MESDRSPSRLQQLADEVDEIGSELVTAKVSLAFVSRLIKVRDALRATQSETTPTEMAVCEISRLVLHRDQPYIFRKHEGCAACEAYDITKPPTVSAPQSAEGSIEGWWKAVQEAGAPISHEDGWTLISTADLNALRSAIGERSGCHFCGRPRVAFDTLFTKDGARICDECVTELADQLRKAG